MANLAAKGCHKFYSSHISTKSVCACVCVCVCVCMCVCACVCVCVCVYCNSEVIKADC